MDFEGYERKGQGEYAAFAATVAAILTAAINSEEDYRLQQVKDRAKQPDSLYKKLQQRGIVTTTTLEDDIKDLAGCRIIFYTNSDVTRFINSGIIHQNFDVLEVKLHHPRWCSEPAASAMHWLPVVCQKVERNGCFAKRRIHPLDPSRTFVGTTIACLAFD